MKFLKSIITLIICLQLTIPFVVEDSLRLPILVSHFIEHNHNHRAVTMVHFLADHYLNKHHDEKHDDHGDLPLHNHSDFSFNQNLAINVEIKLFKFIPNYYFKEPQKIAFSQNHFSSRVLLSIWRPPKNC
ncbi:hypothetical protein QLS31_03925 [Flavobacterium sp. XS2P24]|uniref:hypothetical protein n=1 Tax=Flavobacterium sp. XS2P24 TaxID=3041249 RepID=UPI0024A85A78|nr:hypothetical protein [Flavobacterium sp. XS2P24]MDI6048970.1 hypothetical protein [Flavobacterium sp. XS2P24]